MRRVFGCALALVFMPLTPTAHAAAHQVTYKVWSEITPLNAAAIGYNGPDGARLGATNAPLPWSKDLAWTDDTKHPIINVAGYSSGEGSQIYCQILVDGQVVDEGNRVEGATCMYAMDDVRRRHCLVGSHGTLVGVADMVPGDPCSVALEGAPRP